MTPGWIFVILIALEFGSFANACIYRWPRGYSVSWPRRSFCPWCKTPIAWFHNLPVLSYLMLRGRCATCRGPISIMYPVNEILVPGILLAFLWAAGFEPGWFVIGLLIFSFILVVTTQVDVEWKIVPDEASFTMMAAGLLVAPVNMAFGPELSGVDKVMFSVIGLAAGGGLLLFVGWAGGLLFKKEVMGMGDVKLLAGYGTLLGWQGVFSTFMLACVLASVLSIYFIATKSLKRNRYIPFAPFLNIAAALTLLWLLKNPGDSALNMLSGWMRF